MGSTTEKPYVELLSRSPFNNRVLTVARNRIDVAKYGHLKDERTDETGTEAGSHLSHVVETFLTAICSNFLQFGQGKAIVKKDVGASRKIK